MRAGGGMHGESLGGMTWVGSSLVSSREGALIIVAGQVPSKSGNQAGITGGKIAGA
ncbi:hypothetical protein RISK_001320 [Rhodopirellula islandica]|uniref:Uncharacterized protein n=1 Tax=Rhodopirellula islandica TaxID=595434 RepID=A0A0J1BJ50_RHOIS|nr:hypothetical protein RISK_001320 [Rhodopirellula islandica]